jgi:GNAT superfamily N-acetyltransferase
MASMAMLVEIEEDDRDVLISLFENCRYDRVLIDSVLEGHFGGAWADSRSKPVVARLDSGAFTMLGGDPMAMGVKALLRHAPISYVTPQNDEWRRVLQEAFGVRVAALRFTDFSPAALDAAHLAGLIGAVPPGSELVRIDKPLAERLSSDIGNEYFLENFRSVDDFLGRGVGFCVLCQERVVSAATSMARSSKAIDIEIETAPDFRGQGLGTAVGAKLVANCLEQGIEPRWLAANPVSERLALKLGYVQGETYTTFAIQ